MVVCRSYFIRGFCLFFVCCMGISMLGAQDYTADFSAALQSRDTAVQRRILRSWESAKPLDPGLFTSYFNYYFAKSQDETLVLDRNPRGEMNLQILKNDKVAGYISSSAQYVSIYLDSAFRYIDSGINLFPARLDMRFGKIHVLGRIMAWEQFTQEIIKLLEYSSEIKNQWTWSNNEPLKDADDFLLNGVQDYVNQLYDTGADSLLADMRLISEATLKYYPLHIESLSNIAITHLIYQDYDKALEYLHRAEQINPHDHIVLTNIAQAYKLSGKPDKAIEYFEKALRYGNDEAKEMAKTELEKLRK